MDPASTPFAEAANDSSNDSQQELNETESLPNRRDGPNHPFLSCHKSEVVSVSDGLSGGTNGRMSAYGPHEQSGTYGQYNSRVLTMENK